MKPRSAFTAVVRRFISIMLDLSYLHLAALYFLAIVAFGLVYFWLAIRFPDHGPTVSTGSTPSMLLDSVYFSTITATSVGYGDIVPRGFSKILASVESFFALFVFGMLVAKSVAERQEVAIYRMHKVTFEEIFQHVREGLYIVRRDLDTVMRETQTGLPRPQTLRNLETALCYAHVLFEDIPSFYDTTLGLYTIDARREKLLAEGVQRTLSRLEVTLKTLRESGHDASADPDVKDALRELIGIAKRTLGAWKLLSSDEVRSELQNAMSTVAKIETMV